MSEVFTIGIWTVKAGHDEDFVRLWRRLGERTLRDFPHAAGTLLRDRAQPGRYVSFGPWPSAEEAERWRSSAAFRRGVGELAGVLDDFAPGTFDVVVRVGERA